MKSILLILFFCFAVKIEAQENLSLNDLWEIMKEKNYSLRQQQKLIEIASAEVSIQSSTQYPVLNIGASVNYQSEIASLELIPGSSPINIEAGVKDQYDLSLSIIQPVFTGFRISSLINAARHQLQSKEIEKNVIENNLLLTIGNLYYQSQLNILQRKVLLESKRRTENQLTLICNLMEADQKTAYDTLEVSSRKLHLHSQIIKLKDGYDILLSKIRFLINADNFQDLKPVEINSVTLTVPDLSNIKHIALNNRSELNFIDKQRKTIEYNKVALKSSYYPQIYANASYHYAKPGVNFFRNEWMDYYSVGVSFQWELWKWGYDKSKIRQSELTIEKIDLQKEQLKNDILQQVEESYKNLEMAITQINLNKSLVALEKERYRIVKEKYEQGLSTSLDLNDAEHSLTAIELELQKEYISWFQNQLLLDYATGMIAKDIQEVSNEK